MFAFKATWSMAQIQLRLSKSVLRFQTPEAAYSIVIVLGKPQMQLSFLCLKSSTADRRTNSTATSRPVQDQPQSEKVSTRYPKLKRSLHDHHPTSKLAIRSVQRTTNPSDHLGASESRFRRQTSFPFRPPPPPLAEFRWFRWFRFAVGGSSSSGPLGSFRPVSFSMRAFSCWRTFIWFSFWGERRSQ